jgi:hypothetical protein
MIINPQHLSRRALLGICCALLSLTATLSVPVPAVAATRAEVLSRAEVWVEKYEPYSQSRYATASGDLVPTSATYPSSLGYRTDCSGFASMSLGLTTKSGAPLSLDTATLPAVCTKITKADLKPGDLILRPKNLVIDGKRVPYGHAGVFVRWVDASKTRYVLYHESSSKDGAVAVEMRYPFGSEVGFAPYRYNGIEEERLRRSRLWYGPVAPTGTTVSALGSSSAARSASADEATRTPAPATDATASVSPSPTAPLP